MAGHSVREGVRGGERKLELERVNSGAGFAILGDLGAKPANLGNAFKDVEVVVHLAARVHDMRGAVSSEEYRRVNVCGTEVLARAAVEHGTRRFVFVSTAKVNGELTVERSFSEDDPANPMDPYALSKWEAEESLRSIAVETGLEIVIVRAPLVYGPGVRANFLRLMRLVDLGFPMALPNTNNRRSLIGVGNLADCLVRCVTHPAAANQTFMVSDGEDVSTRGLVLRLAPLLGRTARFLPVPEAVLRLAARLVGKRSAINKLLGSIEIDSSKIRRTLEWEPPITLSCGLEATARWYLESFGRLA
jgi:UDP-glucose 4-epimerase